MRARVRVRVRVRVRGRVRLGCWPVVTYQIGLRGVVLLPGLHLSLEAIRRVVPLEHVEEHLRRSLQRLLHRATRAKEAQQDRAAEVGLLVRVRVKARVSCAAEVSLLCAVRRGSAQLRMADRHHTLNRARDRVPGESGSRWPVL